MSPLNKKIIIISLLFLITILTINKLYKSSEELDWSIVRNVRYSFTIENNTEKVIKNVVFETFSPLPLNSNQKLIELQSNKSFNFFLDEFGNQILFFDIDFIPPYSKKIISVTAKLLMSKKVGGAKFNNKLFLMPQPLIESKNNKLVRFALRFEGDELQKLNSIYDWEVANIDYSGYGSKDRGAIFALNNLEGDCTEFAYLMVAASRALNIPARAVNGYVVHHDSKLHPNEFHTWAEVWFDGAWRVIDAQKKEFMSSQENYLAMNIVTATSKNEPSFKRFQVSSPNLIVKMK